MPENFGETLDNVEILRTGRHTASSGKQVEIGREDLERIAAGYDTAFHEAPVVIGHPADNQPAYGWVKALKVMGDKLVATLDLVPEFVEAVRRGLFKKRSASIYHDLDGKGMYLRHVGFLGAVPPAVKALTDINLDDKAFESYTIDLTERKQPMNWKDWFKKRIDESQSPRIGVVLSTHQGNRQGPGHHEVSIPSNRGRSFHITIVEADFDREEFCLNPLESGSFFPRNQ